MRRRVAILVLAAGAILGGPALRTWAQGGEGSDQAARQGAAVYAEFCQACHGPRGEAIGTGPAFAAIRYDPGTAREVIARGRDTTPEDGVAMPPYAQTSGGLLSEPQIEALLAYMETWKTDATPPLPAPNLHAALTDVPDHFGDAEAGARIYATTCYGCHGDRGKGRVPPNFPPFHYPEGTLQRISQGTGHRYMPAFGEASGGPLSDQDLTDLDTYIASWSVQTPRDVASPAGYSTLLLIVGVAAILFVGYMHQTHRAAGA